MDNVFVVFVRVQCCHLLVIDEDRKVSQELRQI